MVPREFVNYQDKLYWIYRKVKHHQVKEGSINDLKEFWNKRTTYLKYKLVHKRGILLYGDPGCGKSGRRPAKTPPTTPKPSRCAA
jgi:predicted ATPase